MEEMIINEGFIQSENINEYVKGDWTIRLDKDIIEVFDNPEKGSGIYYCGPIKKVDLQAVLDDIYNFEYKD